MWLKKVNCTGDSITVGVGGEDTPFIPGGYRCPFKMVTNNISPDVVIPPTNMPWLPPSYHVGTETTNDLPGIEACRDLHHAGVSNSTVFTIQQFYTNTEVPALRPVGQLPTHVLVIAGTNNIWTGVPEGAPLSDNVITDIVSDTISDMVALARTVLDTSYADTPYQPTLAIAPIPYFESGYAARNLAASLYNERLPLVVEELAAEYNNRPGLPPVRIVYAYYESCPTCGGHFPDGHPNEAGYYTISIAFAGNMTWWPPFTFLPILSRPLPTPTP